MDLKTALKKTEGVTKYSHRILGHCNAALASMQRMKEFLQMTDVVLKVDNGCIQAHRLVLASTSDYFFAMFNNDMLEKQMSEIVLRDINVETLKLLVDYLYSGDIQITEDNVESLLSASSLLQIWPVREGCSEFLQQHLHPLNCFGVWRFADAHGLTDLKDKSLRFVQSNFHKAVDSSTFIFRDFLVTTVASEVLVHESAEYKELLYEIMKSFLLPERRTFSSSEGTSPRRVEGWEQYVFAIGGSSTLGDIGTNTGEVYIPRADKWQSIAPMHYPRFGCGVTTAKRRLYAVGGRIHGETCESYNPETNTWSIITSMNNERNHLGVCSLHEIVYALGGTDDSDYYLSSVEKYDPLTGVWSSGPSMSTGKSHFGTAVIDNCIYTLGGNTCSSDPRIVERLDPREGKWSRLRDMKRARLSCGATAVDSVLLYCTGGISGGYALASGERFDIRTNVWEEIEPMLSTRYGHQIVKCGNKLIALGGFGLNNHALSSVELYDVKLNQWTELARMIKKRGYVGALSLTGSILNLYKIDHLL